MSSPSRTTTGRLQKLGLSLLVLLGAAATGTSAQKLCDLGGPDFPAPQKLSASPAFQQAKARLGAALGSNAALRPNDTAFSFALFSASEPGVLYEHHYTPPGANVGVPKVDGDSVYRIGSVSKVFAVWAFLAQLGDSHFNEPVTKFVPELKTAKPVYPGAAEDSIDSVRWEDVTLGDLASQTSGIGRDVGLGEQYLPGHAKEAGLPPLDKAQVPKCGAGTAFAPEACTYADMIQLIQKQTPVFPTSHSPAYSNVAYGILSVALQRISGKGLDEVLGASIFQPLGMGRTSLTPPKNLAHGVIPGGDPVASWYGIDLGSLNAAGGIFSSTNDMVKAGRAILSSSTLSKAQTRRWMSPRVFAGTVGYSVGAPWEIATVAAAGSSQHHTTWYTKEGDLGMYNAALALSPDHGFGFVVLAGGSSGADVRSAVAQALSETFPPAVEEAARAEARSAYAGTYADEATGSSVVVEVDGQSGLRLTKYISRGVNGFAILNQAKGTDVSELRLFPTTLTTTCHGKGGAGADKYMCRAGFRGVARPPQPAGPLADPCIGSWTGFGGVKYGQKDFDDWVFELGPGGEVVALNARFARLRLTKKNAGGGGRNNS